MASAKTNGNNAAAGASVAAWAATQAEVEKAQSVLDEKRKNQQEHAKAVYEQLGSKPFTVKALGGRKFRAICKKERKTAKGTVVAEAYMILPVAENEAQAGF